ncbi:hypothetical protein CCACVL1_16453 [Corchorus capsularis]|uniref:Late embryogenesis abundant protein, LEA-14 n=1 Tax=Corchorus capsularis TaxID=210143 RepID=A0A1R3HWS8_COCAP|nr:hypothetical protein CCACVL1_16453 [Corchorus capsularis]
MAPVNPQQPLLPSRPRPDSTCDCDSFKVSLIIMGVLIATIVVAVVALCVWEILEMINCGNNPRFGLNSLSVSNLNISGPEVTGIWDVEFLAKSPDFLHANNYFHPALSVYYKNQQLLLEEYLPRIHVPKKTTISYRVNALAMATSIQDKAVADAIAKDWSQQKLVSFTVKLRSTNEIGLIVKVVCARIKVGFSSNSTSSSSQGTLLPESSANTYRQAFTRCSTGYHVKIPHLRDSH